MIASRLVWFDRNGHKMGVVGKPGQYEEPRLAPDEKGVAVGLVDPRVWPSVTLAVSYPDPTVNCADVSVACSPSSGSLFPVGTTTVTCTASDAGGNSAACSFTVPVFSLCLQDDSDSASAVLFNPSTGEYRYCCNGVVIASGRGAASVRGCTVSITHNEGNRRVLIKADTSSGKGTAALQMGLGQSKCTITDRNMSNNNCDCS